MSSDPLREIYRWAVLLALPGSLWIAFEMYGLTLGGAQMLFFSIAHGTGFTMFLVLTAFVLEPLWLIQSVAALLIPRFAMRLGIPRGTHVFFVVSVSAQIALLSTYQSWSGSAARLGVCLLGLALTGARVYLVGKHVVFRPAVAGAQPGR